MSQSRRGFLGTAIGAGLAGYAFLRSDGLERVRAAVADAGDASPEQLARDEDFWFEVQQAFTVDRSLINLNNGGVSPSPRVVQDAMRRHLEFSNQAPSRNLWEELDPKVETVRAGLARHFRCDAEEIAVTRNASEALETAIMGIDLEAGDEILTTAHDYPRMLTTCQQRVRRENIQLRKIPIPAPAISHDDYVQRFSEAISEKTRVILVSHTVFLTGQFLPVERICPMARERGILTIVDGAHAFAHKVFDGGAIGCDYYGTSLHKWLTAPHGTGFLYVRKDRIPATWPLMAAPESLQNNVRKFEEIGTHPAANRLAVAEALNFYEGLGPQRKEARLRYLRDRFARRLTANPKVRSLTNLDPEHSCAMATLTFDGLDEMGLVKHLWNKHHIIVVRIDTEDVKGIRISPNVYTAPWEIDRFCEVVEAVLQHGLPA